MSDIFLSYSRADADFAEQLHEALSAEGWSVWYDSRIRSGSSFEREIEAAITHARCVVVLWSSVSVDSDWVRSEAAEGLERGILVPAVISRDIKLPLRYRQLQTTDLIGWNGSRSAKAYQRLTGDIRQVLNDSSEVKRIWDLAASNLVKGKIRGLGRPHSDGLESMSVEVNRSAAEGLPFEEGSRVPIRLSLGSETYAAGLKATSRNRTVWISPDLADGKGQRLSLAKALLDHGFRKNQSVLLIVQGDHVRVLPVERRDYRPPVYGPPK